MTILDHPEIDKVHIYGIEWLGRPEGIRYLQRFPLKTLLSNKIRENSVRAIYNFKSQCEWPSIFIKRYKTKALEEKFKLLLHRPPSLIEANNLLLLEKAGLRVPKFLLWGVEKQKIGWGETYLVTEVIKGVPLNQLFQISKDLLDSLIEELAVILSLFTRHSLHHRDLHAGNILYRIKDNLVELVVLDFHQLKKVNNHLKIAVEHMALVWNSVPCLNKDAKEEIAKRYYEKVMLPITYSNYRKLVIKKTTEQKIRHIKRRLSWCIKGKAQFERFSYLYKYIYKRKDFPLDVLKRAIFSETYDKRWIKIDKKSSVAVIYDKDFPFPICIKVYHRKDVISRLKDIFRESPAQRSWLTAHRFILKDIDTPFPLAFIEGWPFKFWGPCYFMTIYEKDALNVPDYIKKNWLLWDVDERKAFLKAISQFISILHKKGVFHRDLKSTNILVKERLGKWNFMIVDLDSVSFYDELSTKQIDKNIKQFLKSFPYGLSQEEKRYFLENYFR